MKKLLVFAMLFAFAGVAQAQWFAGGALGYESVSTKNGDAKTDDVANFTIAPEVGYTLNDKWEIGLGVAYFSLKDVTEPIEEQGWAVAPFAQYYAATLGKFSLSFKGSVFFASADDKLIDETSDSYGVSIVPAINYNLSKTFTLFANLNFASLNYVYEKTGDLKEEKFAFGTDSGNVMNTQDFQIGFRVNF